MACNDQRLVKGTDEGEASLLRNPGADRVPVLCCAIVENHLGAEGPGIGDLDARGVRRHDDEAGDFVEPGRERHALRVIA